MYVIFRIKDDNYSKIAEVFKEEEDEFDTDTEESDSKDESYEKKK